jgi:REP element-mobilizing transposase RayT
VYKGGYHIGDQNAVHFITLTVIQWVDVFSRQEYCKVIVKSLNYCVREKGLKVHAWCLMSNHLHLIVSCDVPTRLSDLLRDFKKFTSYKITRAIEQNERESRKSWMLWIF